MRGKGRTTCTTILAKESLLIVVIMRESTHIWFEILHLVMALMPHDTFSSSRFRPPFSGKQNGEVGVSIFGSFLFLFFTLFELKLLFF